MTSQLANWLLGYWTWHMWAEFVVNGAIHNTDTNGKNKLCSLVGHYQMVINFVIYVKFIRLHSLLPIDYSIISLKESLTTIWVDTRKHSWEREKATKLRWMRYNTHYAMLLRVVRRTFAVQNGEKIKRFTSLKLFENILKSKLISRSKTTTTTTTTVSTTLKRKTSTRKRENETQFIYNYFEYVHVTVCNL